MTSYTIEFNGSGEVSEASFSSDSHAIAWVESVLENRGYDVSETVSGDWDSNGESDEGKHERMLFWASEADAENDPGANAICQLCVIRF